MDILLHLENYSIFLFAYYYSAANYTLKSFKLFDLFVFSSICYPFQTLLVKNIVLGH